MCVRVCVGFLLPPPWVVFLVMDRDLQLIIEMNFVSFEVVSILTHTKIERERYEKRRAWIKKKKQIVGTIFCEWISRMFEVLKGSYNFDQKKGILITQLSWLWGFYLSGCGNISKQKFTFKSQPEHSSISSITFCLCFPF